MHLHSFQGSTSSDIQTSSKMPKFTLTHFLDPVAVQPVSIADTNRTERVEDMQFFTAKNKNMEFAKSAIEVGMVQPNFKDASAVRRARGNGRRSGRYQDVKDPLQKALSKSLMTDTIQTQSPPVETITTTTGPMDNAGRQDEVEEISAPFFKTRSKKTLEAPTPPQAEASPAPTMLDRILSSFASRNIDTLHSPAADQIEKEDSVECPMEDAKPASVGSPTTVIQAPHAFEDVASVTSGRASADGSPRSNARRAPAPARGRSPSRRVVTRHLAGEVLGEEEAPAADPDMELANSVDSDEDRVVLNGAAMTATVHASANDAPARTKSSSVPRRKRDSSVKRPLRQEPPRKARGRSPASRDRTLSRGDSQDSYEEEREKKPRRKGGNKTREESFDSEDDVGELDAPRTKLSRPKRAPTRSVSKIRQKLLMAEDEEPEVPLVYGRKNEKPLPPKKATKKPHSDRVKVEYDSEDDHYPDRPSPKTPAKSRRSAVDTYGRYYESFDDSTHGTESEFSRSQYSDDDEDDRTYGTSVQESRDTDDDEEYDGDRRRTRDDRSVGSETSDSSYSVETKDKDFSQASAQIKGEKYSFKEAAADTKKTVGNVADSTEAMFQNWTDDIADFFVGVAPPEVVHSTVAQAEGFTKQAKQTADDVAQNVSVLVDRMNTMKLQDVSMAFERSYVNLVDWAAGEVDAESGQKNTDSKNRQEDAADAAVVATKDTIVVKSAGKAKKIIARESIVKGRRRRAQQELDVEDEADGVISAVALRPVAEE